MQTVCPECNTSTQVTTPFCPKCGVSLANAKMVAVKEPGAATSEIQQNVGGRWGRRLMLLGALGLIFGALLPWVTVSGIAHLVGGIHVQGAWSTSGYEGDGILTFGIGVMVLLFGLLRKGQSARVYSVLCALGILGAGGIALLDLANVDSALATIDTESFSASFGDGLYVTMTIEYLSASIGVGLYMTLLGALLAFIGAILPAK